MVLEREVRMVLNFWNMRIMPIDIEGISPLDSRLPDSPFLSLLVLEQFVPVPRFFGGRCCAGICGKVLLDFLSINFSGEAYGFWFRMHIAFFLVSLARFYAVGFKNSVLHLQVKWIWRHLLSKSLELDPSKY
jgi:hypothetical protein